MTVCSWVIRKLAPDALDRSLDRSFRRDPVGKRSPKGCSRSARPPRTSQATARTKREQSWGLEKRNRAKR
jgi:hypothetical protein